MAISRNPDVKAAEDGLRDLSDKGLLLIAARDAGELRSGIVDDLDAGLLGQQDDAHQQTDGDCAQHQQRRCRVARLGLSKRRHPVADCLDTGQRRAARRERPRHQEDKREAGDRTAFGVHDKSGGFGPYRIAQYVDPEQAPAEHEPHADDERIGRDGEGHPGFANTTQVQRHHQHDREHAEQHLVILHERDRGSDIRHRRGGRNSHRENVIHHQRAGDGQAGIGAQVGGDHLIVAAAGWVGVHVLPVAGDHDQHHRRHGYADPRRE